MLINQKYPDCDATQLYVHFHLRGSLFFRHTDHPDRPTMPDIETSIVVVVGTNERTQIEMRIAGDSKSIIG